SRFAVGDWYMPGMHLVTINQAPTRTTSYVPDILHVQYMTRTNRPTMNVGQPVAIGDALYAPIGAGVLVDDIGAQSALGCFIVPGQPALVQAVGGGLTLLGTYQYCAVEVLTYRSGRTWRSPPSIPQTVVMTGTNASVQWTVRCPVLDGIFVKRTIELYRTANNGSLFRCVNAFTAVTDSALLITDSLADTAIVNGKLLYTHGEVATGITPRPAHVAWFGDRLWIASADFRRRLHFSKKVGGESMPEMNDIFVVELPDDASDITQIQAMDDRLAVFTESAIYIVTGDGPDNTGAGAFPTYVKISSEVGCIVGGKSVSTGDAVYFTSLRGIQRVWKNDQIDYVGEGVDVCFNQPQVQTPVTVLDAAFVEHLNEIRFVTANFVLVYDREFGIWYRDVGGLVTGGTLVAGCYDGDQFVLQRSNETVYYEGSSSQVTDNGTAFTPIIRSAWIRPGVLDQRMRLYMARIIMTRTAGGANATPTLRIYYDNDDTLFESFSPSAVIPGATVLVRGSAQPRRHRCSTFSLEARLPTSDTTVRLDAWAAEIGMKRGAFKNSAAERWV
ncbi:MAG TPA: hypothetical protein VMS92_24310, partial [Mycobacterium sp.]|nr:hypothetical protein [Mycobacterium sp.]